MAQLAGKAHQGAIAILAVAGAGYTPPVAATYPPRMWTIGPRREFGAGRRVR